MCAQQRLISLGILKSESSLCAQWVAKDPVLLQADREDSDQNGRMPRFKFWKSENSPISWTEWNILINFCVNIDINKIWPKRLRNDIFHRSRLCRALNSEKVKMALSLELSGILWWNFAYTLILTWCSPWDSQMTFGIGWGFAEVQILKKSEN